MAGRGEDGGHQGRRRPRRRSDQAAEAAVRAASFPWLVLSEDVALCAHPPRHPTLTPILTRYAPIFPGLVLREDDVDANEMMEADISERTNLADEIEAEIQSRRATVRPPRAEGGTSPTSASPAGNSPAHGRFVRPRQGPLASEEDLRHMREEIRRHIIDSELEIIVLVEAIEPSSSNTFQARHSYMASDIEFDAQFAPTMSVKMDGRAHLDWNSFHKLTDVPFNARAVNSSLS